MLPSDLSSLYIKRYINVLYSLRVKVFLQISQVKIDTHPAQRVRMIELLEVTVL